MTEQSKQILKNIIASKSFSTGNEFTLASGKQSSYYFNMKFTTLDPQGAYHTSHLFLNFLHKHGIYYFGGLEVGAIPIAASLSSISAQTQYPIQAFFVRKTTKTHGEKIAIEGIRDPQNLRNVSVAIAEDVTTTGQSAMHAVNALRAVGAKVETVLTIVDRQEGATTFFNKHGVNLHSLFKADEFIGQK